MTYIEMPMPVSPYSIHDYHLEKIECTSSAIKMLLTDKYGILNSTPISLEFPDADIEDSYVYFMKRKSHKLTGQYYNLKQFLKKYPEFDFEIIDHTYGCQMAIFSGIMYFNLDEHECMIRIVHRENMIFGKDAPKEF